MCGIIGAFSATKVDFQKLKKATDVLSHRGPDAGGYYTDPAETVFLGHRRLSIIDLSTGANQPMESACGRFVMIYNGETYNYPALREKLPGQLWKTHGDTEVILELFARYGEESFKWLNGIFAFAIYDKHEQKIWVCRDHIGIKPLFVYHGGGAVIFASEIKAIKASAPCALEIDRRAIPFFLHLGYIPEPLTIYQDIEKFPAGHYGTIDVKTGSWSVRRYWQAEDHFLVNAVTDEKQALDLYRKKLYTAVEGQMLSDVPLGTFLSGGIDSSLVTAVASKISVQKVKTFNIGFDVASHDESKYASEVADHLKTDHHLFKVTSQDVLALVSEIMSVYDEPFADASAFPTMLVSKLARKHVTVVLSGDGGDELFQGYGMYTWAERLGKPESRLLRKPLSLAGKIMGQRHERAGLVYNYSTKKNIPSHIFSQEQYFFSERELSQMLVNKKFDFSRFNKLPSKGVPREKQAFWDLEHYLKDDLLVKIDRASMHYGLEARVPLLDRELVEFALSLPLQMKLNSELGTKYLMKKVLYEMVPRNIFERPKKGFSIPLDSWLRSDLKPLVTKYLSQEQIAVCGFVEPAYVARLLKDYYSGKSYYYNRVWVLLILHWWYASIDCTNEL
jgi:asparagine synthase (glutamine-hydrolysing)